MPDSLSHPDVQEVEDFAPYVGYGPNHGMNYGTEHLSPAVNTQPFKLVISTFADAGGGPMIGHWMSLAIGDRENPQDLTDDEINYVTQIVRTALKNLKYSMLDDGDQGGE